MPSEPARVTAARPLVDDAPASRHTLQEALDELAALRGPPPAPGSYEAKRWEAHQRIRAAQQTAATCAACGARIATGAPVWLALHTLGLDGRGMFDLPYRQSYPAPTCATCAAEWHPSWWHPPLPCGGCGRQVYYKRAWRPTKWQDWLGKSSWRQRAYCSAACRPIARNQRRA